MRPNAPKFNEIFDLLPDWVRLDPSQPSAWKRAQSAWRAWNEAAGREAPRSPEAEAAMRLAMIGIY